jgi:MFS family permease
VEELKMTPSQYSAAANFFLVGFIVFLLPGSLFLRIIGPSRLVGIACVAWGFFTALQTIIHSYAALAGLRTVIGICEGLGNGVVLCKYESCHPNENI